MSFIQRFPGKSFKTTFSSSSSSNANEPTSADSQLLASSSSANTGGITAQQRTAGNTGPASVSGLTSSPSAGSSRRPPFELGKFSQGEALGPRSGLGGDAAENGSGSKLDSAALPGSNGDVQMAGDGPAVPQVFAKRPLSSTLDKIGNKPPQLGSGAKGMLSTQLPGQGDAFYTAKTATNLLSESSVLVPAPSGDGSRPRHRNQAPSLPHATDKYAMTLQQANGSSLSLPSSVGGHLEDPFQEVNKTINGQLRKIRELEGHVREQNNTIDQLRSKMNDAQEASKRSDDSVMTLKEQLAKAEKSLELKDDELAKSRKRIEDLEHDRGRMLAENSNLTKAMASEKKKFIADLKTSTKMIIRLQGIRAALGQEPMTCAPLPPSQEIVVHEDSPAKETTTAVNAAIEQAEKEKTELTAKINELEQSLFEKDADNQELAAYWNIAATIIQECNICSEKLQNFQQGATAESRDQSQPPPSPAVVGA